MAVFSRLLPRRFRPSRLLGAEVDVGRPYEWFHGGSVSERVDRVVKSFRSVTRIRSAYGAEGVVNGLGDVRGW